MSIMAPTPWEEYVDRPEEELFNELARGPGINTPNAARMWERRQSLRVADAVSRFEASTNASSKRIERLTRWMLVLTVVNALMAALTAWLALSPCS